MLRLRIYRYFCALSLLLLLVAAGLFSSSCDKLDDHRVPVYPVSIVFPTVAIWDVYGVGGAMAYRSFVRNLRLPQGFPYTAVSQTGYGGVLLVGDVTGKPKAFDLACPVENKPDVRVRISEKENVAVCDKCGSTYDVFTLDGHPLSGPAVKDGYGLRQYKVAPGRAGDYMVISN